MGYYTIRAEDIGRPTIRAFRRTQVGDILQVENDEQLARRMSSDATD